MHMKYVILVKRKQKDVCEHPRGHLMACGTPKNAAERDVNISMLRLWNKVERV